MTNARTRTLIAALAVAVAALALALVAGAPSADVSSIDAYGGQAAILGAPRHVKAHRHTSPGASEKAGTGSHRSGEAASGASNGNGSTGAQAGSSAPNGASGSQPRAVAGGSAGTGSPSAVASGERGSDQTPSQTPPANVAARSAGGVSLSGLDIALIVLGAISIAGMVIVVRRIAHSS